MMRADQVQRLFDATASGNMNIVDSLLDAGIPTNVRNGRGQTPLIIAARTGQADMVRKLLARGARLKVRTDALLGLREPVYFEDVRTTFERARASVIVQEVLQSGGGTFEEESPADMQAMELLESTEDLLCEASPMLTAAVCGHLEVVDVLLRAGADADATDWSETPPIVGAASQGHVHIVERLIRAGASIDAGTGFTALEEAVVKGHERVVACLIACGADVNRRNEDGGTVLMIAAATGHLSVVQQLVNAGADVDVITDGEAALSCAASYGHLGVYAYLLPRSCPEAQARGDLALGAYLEYVAQL